MRAPLVSTSGHKTTCAPLVLQIALNAVMVLVLARDAPRLTPCQMVLAVVFQLMLLLTTLVLR